MSGGVKVKVSPCGIYVAEPAYHNYGRPTNYLDRDGLGALTKAIDDFKGGVIIISHNREFTNAVTQEKWIMEGEGSFLREGESISKFEDKTDTNAGDDEVVFDHMVMRLKSSERKL